MLLLMLPVIVGCCGFLSFKGGASVRGWSCIPSHKLNHQNFDVIFCILTWDRAQPDGWWVCWLRSVLFCCFCFVLLLWVLLSGLWRLLVCQWDNYPHGQLSYRHKGFVGFWRRQLVMAYLHNLSTYKLVQVLITGWSSIVYITSCLSCWWNVTERNRQGSARSLVLLLRTWVFVCFL